jgi:hypothetical protein
VYIIKLSSLWLFFNVKLIEFVFDFNDLLLEYLLVLF